MKIYMKLDLVDEKKNWKINTTATKNEKTELNVQLVATN